MSRPARIFILVLAALLTPTTTPPAHGQSTESEDRKRFSISVLSGAASDGPSGSLRTTLDRHGFGARSGGGCFIPPILCAGPTEFPRTKGGPSHVMLSARYRTVGPVALGAILTPSTSFGETTGAGRSNPTAEPSLQTLAFLVSLESPERLRIGVGPAFYRVRTRHSIDGASRLSADSKVGLMLEGGIEIPSNSPVFADLSGQYRWVGSAGLDGFEDLSRRLGESTFSMNHGLLAIGIGIRF